VREVRLCKDCKDKDWPTMDVDAPMRTVTETVESNLQGIREFRRIALQMETTPGAFAPEMREHFRKLFRISAAQVMEVANRTGEVVPDEVQEFVRAQFGEPPYPTVLDVWMEDPEFRKQFETVRARK
jgi:hypothetical protein